MLQLPPGNLLQCTLLVRQTNKARGQQGSTKSNLMADRGFTNERAQHQSFHDHRTETPAGLLVTGDRQLVLLPAA